MATSNDATTKNNKKNLKKLKDKGSFREQPKKKDKAKQSKFLQGG